MNAAADKIRDACLRLLAVRDHSRKELLQKLALKGYDRDAVTAVIDELARQGWQDDFRYAESYARSRILKGYGPVRIAYELRQNGIVAATDGADAAQVNLDDIAEAAAGGWMALLEQVYTRKYGHVPALDYREWARRSRFLLHRGFSGSMIAHLSEHLNITLNKF